MAPKGTTAPTVGQIVPGYAIPVINERAARAAAGLLFLVGVFAYSNAIFTGDASALKPFGMLFMFDMAVRLIAGDRWSPTMAVGRLVVRGQQPEWVGAPQKEFAWWMGMLVAAGSCITMGFFSAPFWVTMSICGLCLSLLFLETAFGICVGCKLQTLFSRQEPMYCPGGTCEVASNEPASEILSETN